MRAGRFGTGGGGSSYGPLPPKDGIVRMWNLDELRRAVMYALDASVSVGGDIYLYIQHGADWFSP